MPKLNFWNNDVAIIIIQRLKFYFEITKGIKTNVYCQMNGVYGKCYYSIYAYYNIS